MFSLLDFKTRYYIQSCVITNEIVKRQYRLFRTPDYDELSKKV